MTDHDHAAAQQLATRVSWPIVRSGLRSFQSVGAFNNAKGENHATVVALLCDRGLGIQ